MPGEDGGKEAEQRRQEQERREAIRRQDDAHRARGETTRPDEIAGAHEPVRDGLRPGDEDQIARTLREADGQGRDGFTPAAPPPDTGPEHSVLDELDPEDERRAQLNRVGGIGGQDDLSPAAIRGQQAQAAARAKAEADARARQDAADARRRETLRARDQGRWIAYALIFGGLALVLWALTGGRVESAETGPGAAASPAISPTTAPSTQPPTPTPTPRTTVALSAGAIVATQVGTTTRYTVQNVTGDGLVYDWRHSATCGTHTGVTTPTYSWDHPHTGQPGSCPEEPFHASFISVQITDGGGNSVVRQYTLGSREGIGAVPAGGGVFTPQPTTTAVRTPTPTIAPSPSAAASPISKEPQLKVSYGLNIGLAGAGTLLTLAGGGLLLAKGKTDGGMERIDPPVGSDPCTEQKRREAAARARRDAARRRRESIDRQRADRDHARDELRRAQREEAASKDDRNVSWGEDAETGRRIYTNPDQRARVERAESALRDAQATAERTSAAYDGAGGSGEQTAAAEEQRAADADWTTADAALRECLRLNAPRPTATPPAPTPPAPAPTPPSPQPQPTRPTPLTPPGAAATTTQAPARVCDPLTRKPGTKDDERTFVYRIADLRNAVIVNEQNAAHAPEHPLTQDGDGPGPQGEVGLAAFNDVYQYWSNASDMGCTRAQAAVRNDAELRVIGSFRVRYTIHVYTVTCARREQCNAAGSGYEWVRVSVTMTRGDDEAGETEPKVADVEHAGAGTVPKATMNVVRALFNDLRNSNKRAEADAKAFVSACHGAPPPD